jgi:diaminopimelate epimerase
MRFAKYHGTGNDFVMVEDLEDGLTLRPELIAALCDRRKGIGADGLIRIAPSDATDFFMDYSNADGAPAEMCGNGIRCLATYAFERGLTASSELDVDTRAGVKHLSLDVRDGAVRSVTVDMGPPALERKAIPMTGDPSGTFIGQPLQAGGRTFAATALSMGNPHCVVFLEPADDLASMDVRAIGSAIEWRADLFPNRTNVEFVQPGNGLVEVRVWERGSGETMACGTGACAAVVACALAGRSGRRSTVRFPGGLLDLDWRQEGPGAGTVFLTGPAVCVFDGELEELWLSEHAGAVRVAP